MDHGLGLVAQGADILDIGGESTRPGAEPVDVQDEMDRVVPVIQGLRATWSGPISIDTMKPQVARAAVAAGATLWNDVTALSFSPESPAVAADLACDVVLMHMQGQPQTMQLDPAYDDVLAEVSAWLAARAEGAVAAGVAHDRIWLDPGIGFGKSLAENLAIINNLSLYHGLGCALLFGASRKRLIGALSNEANADQRLGGSICLAMKAVEQGAHIVRVHDVPETVQAVQLWRGLRDAALTALA